MKRFIRDFFPSLIFALLVSFIAAGCASTTSGPTLNAGPVLSQLVGSNVLMDDPNVLALYVTEDCNVAAAQEFRLSVAACDGQLASIQPGLLVPANLQSGIAIACQVLGYTNAQNQLEPIASQSLTPGPPAACLNPPAPASLKLPPLKSAV